MKKSVFSNSLFSALYQGINIIFPFVTSIYVARILRSEVIGSISYAQTFATYFVTFAASGLPTYGLREIARYRNDKQQKNKVFSELFVINALLTTISLFLYGFLLLSNSLLIKDKVLSVCFGSLILWNYINVDWFYMGEEEYRFIAMRSLIIKVICFVLLLITVHSKDDYIEYALLTSFGIGANHLLNIIRLNKYVKIQFHQLDFSYHIRPLLVFAASMILDTIYSKSDITMLGLMSTEKNVGLYTYGHNMPEILMTMCVSFTVVLFPRLSYYYSEDFDKFMSLVNEGIKVIFFITIPITLGFFLIAPDFILFLYGDEFAGAVNIAQVFSLMIIIKGVGNLLGFQLIVCTGNEKKRIPIYCFAALLNIVLNFVLIRYYEGFGAAFASVISELVVIVYLVYIVYKQLRFSFSFVNLFKCVLASLIMAIPVVLVIKFVEGQLLKLILCVVLGAITYLGCGIVFHNEVLKLIFSRFINKKTIMND